MPETPSTMLDLGTPSRRNGSLDLSYLQRVSEQIGAAIKAGKTRFRGISSHHPEVLAAALASGLVDVVMFPIGPFVDDRTTYYLIDGFNKLYGGRLSSLPAWPIWDPARMRHRQTRSCGWR